MLALQITNMKVFMNHLLIGDTFDSFLLEECTISTANTFTIDGHMNTEFFPMAERTPENLPYDFRCYSEIKGLCFDLIKGKHTPLYFKFVLHLKPEFSRELLRKNDLSLTDTSLKSLVLTIKYDGTKAILTTGSSYHTFVMDKTPDVIWDRHLLSFLSEKKIPYEIL